MTTVAHWREDWWQRVQPLYERVFPDSQRKSAADLRAALEKCEYAVHLADDGQRLIGFAFTARFFDLPYLFLDYMAVEPEQRCHGVGAAIVQYLAEWAIGFDGIAGEVDAPSPDEPPDSPNRRRIAFYERHGFRCFPTLFTPGPSEWFHLIVRPLRRDVDLPEPEQLVAGILRIHKAAGSHA